MVKRSERLARIEALLGEEKMEILKEKRVAVFGIGGVGSYAVEALVRSGIGKIDLIDGDKVVPSNLNRQIIATEKTLGMEKVDAAEQRIKEIAPDVEVRKYPLFYLPEEKEKIPFDEFDLVIDAIDTVSAKIDIILEAKKRNIPVISAMGCGNRLDPEGIQCIDLYKTKGDPLAKVMRHELRKRGIKDLLVVCSSKEPLKPLNEVTEEDSRRRSIPASSIFVPASAGLLIASKALSILSDN